MGFFEAVESVNLGFWICLISAASMFILFLGSYTARAGMWAVMIVVSLILAPMIGRYFGYSPAATFYILSGAISSAFIWWDLYARLSQIETAIETLRQRRI